MKAILLLYKGESECSHKIRALVEREFEIVFMRYCDWGESDLIKQGYLATLQADYLFNFSPCIIKPVLLESIRVAAINFHTAPPEYPGRGGCSYALYNGDETYGVTAHLMTEDIDAGGILDVIRFPIHTNDTAESLHRRAVEQIPELAWRWMKTKNIQPNGERWAGPAKRQADFVEFMRIGHSEEMEAKIRACRHSQKPGPYIQLGEVKFWYIEGKS